MRDLADVRREISEIDAALAPLLAKRLRLASDVAAAKRASGRSIDDPAREREILNALTADVETEIAPAFRDVYEAVFAASKDLQRRQAGARTTSSSR